MRFDMHTPWGLGSLCAWGLSVLCTSQPDPISYLPARPPSYPLAVRNPYLSTWMPQDAVKELPYRNPQFWAGQDLGWSVLVRVDDQVYSLMGMPDLDESHIRPATVQQAEFTSTHSLFRLKTGPISIVLDFLSPASPSNYIRQSLPFSYLTVQVMDAGEHSIQVYSDIDSRWTGAEDHSMHAFSDEDDVAIHVLSAEDAADYTEASDMATWGQAVFASRPSNSSTLSALSGNSKSARERFAKRGDLSEQDFSWSGRSVAALAHDLGVVTDTASVTFAVGFERINAINYLGESYTGFYRAKYPCTNEAISFFLDDYDDALEESLHLDRELAAHATDAGGAKYSDIVALSTRQAFGGIDLTIPSDSLDTENPLAFIKELSSNGNVNTIDVIMPAFPIYWVMDPNWIRLLLEPVMKYLAAGRWQSPYMIHDLGTHYPNATGHDDQQAEPMPIEECGNLLALALAYTKATGDTDWTDQYTNIFQKYADYLVENSINIANQLSSNDAAGPLPNETNLAIKAAVGIKAYGELSGEKRYSDIGDDRTDIFFNQGLGTDKNQTHFVLEYPDWPETWKTPYNLYPDVLLGLDTFPTAAYEMNSDFFSPVRAEYGVPLDNRQDWAKSDWNMWLAATLDIGTRDEFIDDLWAYMTNGKHNWPFSDRYVASASHGNTPGVPVLCRARPTVGGHFALLALKGPRCIQSLSTHKMGDTGRLQEALKDHRNEL
ncbi:hypothetical protein N7492_004620 [Penicillium capsulatum]|uniref:Glutaminase n=1 Tax=Penicillium capsulatum TaxID=69766 RepID=A0A9W9IBW5_9EURO|nr:hypothetical protein N7492_004620 [Penicillium capsulatum]KAJ6136264.1 hypothetical protein N7512_001424 [Penicillium capsulatum]